MPCVCVCGYVVLSYYPTSSAVEEEDYVAEIVSLSEGTLNWMRTFDEVRA